MPSVRLNFHQNPARLNDHLNDAQSDPASNDTLILPPPEVELHLSVLERIQDALRWRFQRERAVAINTHRDKWRGGVYSEIAFWDEFLREKGGKYPKDYIKRFDPALPLQPELVEIVNLPKGSTVHVLDVGAGPLTWIGRSTPDWKIEITAVDPLADAYDQLLAAHNLTPPVRTRNVAAEELGRVFPANSFDLVMARNSLDHSLDPISAIQQMVDLARPGGVVFLAHAVNEAITNDYEGLHQWNFRLDGDDFVIEHGGSLTNINTLLSDRATVTSEFLWDHWLQTTIRPR